jgi:hypothetical protein
VAGAAADGECSRGAGALVELGGNWPPARIVEAPSISHGNGSRGLLP